jgi:hypothetical protein
MAGKMLAEVNRMLIHAQQAEQGVVVFIDGAAGPMLETLPDLEFLKIPPVCHDFIKIISRLK